MLEEFHGNGGEGGTWIYKLLYGWETINANIWLPSLSELIGTTGTQSTGTGCYYSAMQGLNISPYDWTDAKGGNQFAYFVPYNASGGGAAIMKACNQEGAWTRTPDLGRYDTAWKTTNAQRFDWPLATASYAVHSAVFYNHV